MSVAFSWSEPEEMDSQTIEIKEKPEIPKKRKKLPRPSSLRFFSTTKAGRTLYSYLCSDICGHRTVWCYSQQGAKETLMYHVKVAH